MTQDGTYTASLTRPLSIPRICGRFELGNQQNWNEVYTFWLKADYGRGVGTAIGFGLPTSVGLVTEVG